MAGPWAGWRQSGAHHPSAPRCSISIIFFFPRCPMPLPSKLPSGGHNHPSLVPFSILHWVRVRRRERKTAGLFFRGESGPAADGGPEGVRAGAARFPSGQKGSAGEVSTPVCDDPALSGSRFSLFFLFRKE